MPVCELCQKSVPKVKSFLIQSMGSRDVYEGCRAGLAAVAPGQQPNVVRAITSAAQRAITK